jgi:acyl dehydratase
MSYGRYFDQLNVGDRFEHWPGRTITEFDDTLFSLMSMNQHPLHIDEHYAAATQHKHRLVEGPLVVSLVIGMSQPDIGGKALAVLEYQDVQHVSSVFHGDTIYARSSILAKEEIAGKTDRGAVLIATEGINQRGETVVTLKRKIVLPRATTGKSK